MRWRHLGGDQDPTPDGTSARNVDRGRRIGIVVSHTLYRVVMRHADRTPATGPLVVVANHSSFFDGPVLFGNLPRRVSFLVKAEAVRGPLGWLLRTVGQYAIDRAAPQRTVLMQALAQLKDGGAIGIFPEGSRGAGDVTDVFNGAGWLAVRAGATVLPVAIRGTAKAGRAPRWRPRVQVLVGPPFPVPSGIGRAAIADTTARIQDALAGLVAELDRRLTPGGPTGADPRQERES
jgi:1-acyl-sn-glycerol-3-phosphate acyltransferase